jgi:hypothetical protein
MKKIESLLGEWQQIPLLQQQFAFARPSVASSPAV